MSGAFEWLDTLTQTVGTVAGKAVDVVGKVAESTAAKAADTQNDQTAARAVATAQATAPVAPNPGMYIGIGAIVLLGAVILLKR
jgi:hypothetical protein